MSIPADHGEAAINERHAWTVLAHVLRPQGRKGEVLAEMLTDFPERFAAPARVFLVAENFEGQEADARRFEVAAYWLPTGRNEGRVVLHFCGIDSIAAAEALAGLDVVVPDTERHPLKEGSTYISDLVGCSLFDTSDASAPVLVGIIIDVHFATTPDGVRRLGDAAPLLTVADSDGSEVLIPFVKAFEPRLDLTAKRIEMTLPPGLLDVNR